MKTYYLAVALLATPLFSLSAYANWNGNCDGDYSQSSGGGSSYSNSITEVALSSSGGVGTDVGTSSLGEALSASEEEKQLGNWN